MEKALSKLFDYQKFAENRKLQDEIDSVHRHPIELSLEEADLVSAAGSPHYKPYPTDDKKEGNRQ